MKILVTGAAGFIGFHLCRRLMRAGHCVVGIDNLNSYYDPVLKKNRLSLLKATPGDFNCRIQDINELTALFSVDVVVHLAAQAGVQYSTVNPDAYMSANVMGTYRMLEWSKAHGVKHFIYASSSSVYGDNPDLPWQEEARLMPANLYGTTKAITEALAQAYEPYFATSGLRFFTVYGPWGRPDMAFYKMARSILDIGFCSVTEGASRDFTPVETVTEFIEKILKHPIGVCNVANGSVVPLLDIALTMFRELNRPVNIAVTTRPCWDLATTSADIRRMAGVLVDHEAKDIDAGIAEYIEWFKEYYYGR